MFNLIVSGVAGAWEGAHLDMDLERFNTFSGSYEGLIDAADPASLRQLENSSALVFYEVGTVGPNAGVVRHGRLRNVARYGKVVSFELELDPDRPYLPREAIHDYERHLSMHGFEQGRKHWAIKDGELPPGLMALAFNALPERGLDTIAQEYRDAVEGSRRLLTRRLGEELKALPRTPEVEAVLIELDLIDAPASAHAPVIETAPPAEVVTDGVALLPDGARVVAVIVGLETYRPGANAIASVEFAKADAEAFRTAVETVFAAHHPVVALLTDADATLATLQNEIRVRAWGLGPDDLFVFYYAGHGFHDETGNRLTAWDTSLANIAGTTLGVEADLMGPVRASPCQRVLAFIDACATHITPPGRKVITALETGAFEAMLQAAVFNAVFLSCRAGEQSYPDRDLSHGIWTHYLLRALNGQAAEAIGPGGYITNATLQDYLIREVPRHVANHERIKAVQTPQAIVRATNTFAIRHVAEPAATALAPSPAAPDPVSPAAPAPEPLTVTSTQFFAERFAVAFPGVRGVRWFTEAADIQRRLVRLLGPPIAFPNASPIWWWANGNIHIHSFEHVEDRRYLMDYTELEITRIAAVTGHSYWGHFLYVEVGPMPATGANPHTSADDIAASLSRRGYADEEYGLVDGDIPISRAEYDDGAAEIGGDLVETIGRAQLRIRYLTPYNFLIAPHDSPINNNAFDLQLVELLRAVLQDDANFDQLVEAVRNLPRRRS